MTWWKAKWKAMKCTCPRCGQEVPVTDSGDPKSTGWVFAKHHCPHGDVCKWESLCALCEWERRSAEEAHFIKVGHYPSNEIRLTVEPKKEEGK